MSRAITVCTVSHGVLVAQMVCADGTRGPSTKYGSLLRVTCAGVMTLVFAGAVIAVTAVSNALSRWERCRDWCSPVMMSAAVVMTAMPVTIARRRVTHARRVTIAMTASKLIAVLSAVTGRSGEAIHVSYSASVPGPNWIVFANALRNRTSEVASANPQVNTQGARVGGDTKPGVGGCAGISGVMVTGSGRLPG